jgi:hypothetical protein
MPSRLDEIKQEVADGTYRVDPAAVAEAMLERSAVYNKRRILSDDQRSLILSLDYCGEQHGDIVRTVGCHYATVTRVIAEHVRPPVFRRRRF